MLSIKQAVRIVQKNLPTWRIESAILYKNSYVFKVFNDDELEGAMDPFYSVNAETGEFRDFSIITDGDIREIARLFNEHDLLNSHA